MFDQVVTAFKSIGFMPHGHCYLWTPLILWGEITSHLLIAIAYFSIPIGLYIFKKKRPDLPFGSVAHLFAAFIFSCGTGHIVDIIVIYTPVYWLQTLVDMITGLISISVAIIFTLRLPGMIAKPKIADLEKTIGDQQVVITKAGRLFKAVINHAPGLIYAKDLEGRHLLDNPATLELIGLPLEEVLGKTDLDFLPDKEAGKQVMERDRSIMQNNKIWIGEEFVNGRWYISVKAPLMDDNGQVVGLVGISQNITDRKLAERKLYEQSLVLESKVNERTEQLLAANQELEKFSYTVAHDLRAPLRAINGFSEALIEDYGDKIPAEGMHYLERVVAAASRMGNLIDELLQLSRLSSVKMKRKNVDLSKIVQSVVDNIKKNNPDRKVDITIQPGLKDNADEQLMTIVFENIFENAWKYTSKKENASVSFGRSTDGVYFIKDNGAGFDMAHSEKLFGAFQRLHTQKEFPGTGVGLATVQRVINKHNGKIYAIAKVGEGATFFFTLGDNIQ